MAKPTTPDTDEDRIDPETETPEAEATETVEDAEIAEEATDAQAAETPEPEPTTDDAPVGDAPAAEAEDAPDTDTPPDPAPEPDPAPAPEQPAARGPGFLPLVLGGVIAAGLGYGAAYLGFAPDQQDNGTEAAISSIEETLTRRTTRLPH